MATSYPIVAQAWVDKTSFTLLKPTHSKLELTNPYHHTRFVMLLPRTLCNKEQTFVVCNSCSGTVIYLPRKSTLTFKILSLNLNMQNTTLEA